MADLADAEGRERAGREGVVAAGGSPGRKPQTYDADARRTGPAKKCCTCFWRTAFKLGEADEGALTRRRSRLLIRRCSCQKASVPDHEP